MSQGQLLSRDGTHVTYWVEGVARTDAPALVLINGLTTNTRFWDHLLPQWSRRHRVLMWDLPGHGASGPAQSRAAATIQGQPEILTQVMDAAGIERAVQIGWSTGSQVMFELYRSAPARCLGLVSLLGSAGHVLDTARLPVPGAAIDWLAQHVPRPVWSGATFALSRATNNRAGHAVGRALGLLGKGAAAQDVRNITEHLCIMHPPTVQTMVHSAQAQSATDLLGQLTVPLLIVTGDRDPFAPADTVGLPMHEAAPGSELLRLQNATHTALLDHAGEIADAVESFIARRCSAR
ncbi:MAG: alpha/beta hydrolase [Myxococcales bacterium]|nr:alpha/beta hydrolase [Myxococcales bacterium]